MRDEDFRRFHLRLIPNVDENSVIGVRMPQLKKFAKALFNMPQSIEFMRILPHRYYEENNLHGLMINHIKDYDCCISELDRFLPYVDNWATCDSIRPKVFKQHLSQLEYDISRWIEADETYVKRFGIEMLMCHYLDEYFDEKYPQMVAQIESDEYYVKMMIAWYFATALAKQYDAVISYIEQHRLAGDVHNKTIQKALESYRVTDEHKRYIRSLRDNI